MEYSQENLVSELEASKKQNYRNLRGSYSSIQEPKAESIMQPRKHPSNYEAILRKNQELQNQNSI